MDSIKADPQSSAVAEEWTGFFLKGCVHIIVSTFFKLASKFLTFIVLRDNHTRLLSEEASSPPLNRYLLRKVSAATAYARDEDLADVELPMLLAPELDSLG